MAETLDAKGSSSDLEISSTEDLCDIIARQQLSIANTEREESAE